MAKIDIRLRVHGIVSDDVAQSLAKQAEAFKDAAAEAGIEHVCDLGGLVIEKPKPVVVQAVHKVAEAVHSKRK